MMVDENTAISAEDTATTTETATTETSDQTTSDDARAVEEAVTTETIDAKERPEHIPEKFWDAEKGELRSDDLAKSYVELEKRFGSFTGAPEDGYKVELSEELQNEGVELDENDPLYETAQEYAKKMNMNQDGFNELINLYGMAKLAENKATDEALQADLQSLGETADRRVQNLSKWADANLDPELAEGFKDMAVSSQAVQAMEKLVSMTRNAKIDSDGAQPTGVSEMEVREMQFAKDEHGNRRIQTDPAFKAEYERKRDLVYGTEPHRRIVGSDQ